MDISTTEEEDDTKLLSQHPFLSTYRNTGVSLSKFKRFGDRVGRPQISKRPGLLEGVKSTITKLYYFLRHCSRRMLSGAVSRKVRYVHINH